MLPSLLTHLPLLKMSLTEGLAEHIQKEETLVRSAFRKSSFKSSPREVEALCRILPGEERIHESSLVKEPTGLPEDPGVKTIYDVLKRGHRISSNGPYLGERDKDGKYKWTTYETVVENARFVGSALIHLGLSAGQDTRVSIAGLHSPEYITVGHALSSYSMVFVPLYYNYKLEDLMQIVNKCRIEFLFCDNYERACQFIEKAEELPTLKHITLLKTTDKNVQIPNGALENSRLNLYDWAYILELGKNHLMPVQPPNPEDIYGIFHSSGTTGRPKGAMISHRALLATTTGPTIQWFSQKMKIETSDKYMSFLSPAHVYEQNMETLATYYGAKIGIYSGSVPKLLEDLQELQPTFIAFVPHLLKKFQAQIRGQLAQRNRLVQGLFNFAIKSKTRDLNNGVINYNTIWDRTIFKPIHQIVGGHLKFIVTGGASISDDVKYFSNIVYGCPVFEGYGQTECAAAATLIIPSDTSVGHIGVPSPWVQIKLVSVPALGYNAENNEGEICLRGAGVMSGYFEQRELTEKTLDAEGWLKTGDIGRWRPNGNLELIDRKANFFKLSQGDYVSPEGVEAIYQTHPIVSQIFVHGRQTESYLVAIIIPSIERLKEIVVGQKEELSRLLKTEEELLQNEQVKNMTLEILCEYGKLKGLSQLEQIRDIYLEPNEFTPDNNCLTPTLKMKRTLILQKYSSIIDEMYKKT